MAASRQPARLLWVLAPGVVAVCSVAFYYTMITWRESRVDEVVDLLEKGNDLDIESAIGQLACFEADEVIPRLVEILVPRLTEMKIREDEGGVKVLITSDNIFKGIQKMGGYAVEPLLKSLSSGDRQTRSVVVVALVGCYRPEDKDKDRIMEALRAESGRGSELAGLLLEILEGRSEFKVEFTEHGVRSRVSDNPDRG